MIGTYGAALLICAAAVALGRGVTALSGHRGWTPLAPASGLAVLLVACEVAIRLPGRATTAVVVVVVLIGLAAWAGFRRPAGSPGLEGLVLAATVLVAVAVPFVASGRFGVLGVSVLNDTHWHLFWTEALRHPSIEYIEPFGKGYPLGPHALTAVAAQATGASVEHAFTGMLIATPVLTGLTALGAVRDLSPARRWLVALFVALPYLSVAWYMQSAFKEPLLGLFLLAFVLALEAGVRDRFARPLAAIAPAAVLCAGILYVYSYIGLAWPAATLVCWLALEATLAGWWRRLGTLGPALRRLAPALGIGAAILLVALLADFSRVQRFFEVVRLSPAGNAGGFETGSLANLVRPLPFLEGSGVWLTEEFRLDPGNGTWHTLFALGALVLVTLGAAWYLRRGERARPAALLGCLLIYLVADRTQAPYTTAKTLVVPAALVALVSVHWLMAKLDRGPWRSPLTWGAAAAAGLLLFVGLKSSYLALRGGRVAPTAHERELRALRPVLHGRRTLALFYDDYVMWKLLGVPVSSPVLPSPTPVSPSNAKPWAYGQLLDFDSVNARTLDRFAYVITTRTNAQSQPPRNFRLVARSPSYEVWQRAGPTPARRVLRESNSYGAVLDCSTRRGRAIARRPGVALVRPRAIGLTRQVGLFQGQSWTLPARLPAGAWDLALDYVSPQDIDLRGPGLAARLPGQLDRPGPLWPVGRLVSRGGTTDLTLSVGHPGKLTSTTNIATIQRLVAVRSGAGRLVPLRAACGRFVDWYRPG